MPLPKGWKEYIPEEEKEEEEEKELTDVTTEAPSPPRFNVLPKGWKPYEPEAPDEAEYLFGDMPTGIPGRKGTPESRGAIGENIAAIKRGIRGTKLYGARAMQYLGAEIKTPPEEKITPIERLGFPAPPKLLKPSEFLIPKTKEYAGVKTMLQEAEKGKREAFAGFGAAIQETGEGIEENYLKSLEEHPEWAMSENLQRLPWYNLKKLIPLTMEAMPLTVGIMATAAAATITTRRPELGLMIVGSAFGSVSAGEMFVEAKKHGLSDVEALADSRNAGLGEFALEFVPTFMFLKMLKVAQRAGKPLAKNVAKEGIKELSRTSTMARSMGKLAVAEGIEESLQTLKDNLIQRGFDPTQDITEGMAQSGAIGALMGLFLGAGGYAGGKKLEAVDRAKAEEQAGTPRDITTGEGAVPPTPPTPTEVKAEPADLTTPRGAIPTEATVTTGMEMGQTRRDMERMRLEEEERAPEIERVRRERAAAEQLAFAREREEEVEKEKEAVAVKKREEVAIAEKAKKLKEKMKKPIPAALEAIENVAKAATKKKFGEWVGKRVSTMNEKVEGSGEAWINKLADQYGIDRDAPNFISKLKRAVIEEKKVLPKAPPVVSKPVLPKKPVSPIGERPVISEKAFKQVGEGEELIPKHKAVKLVKATSLEGKPTVNTVYDVYDGVYHIASAYGQELERNFQNYSTEDQIAMAKEIQKIWKGVTSSELYSDMTNTRPSILEKIAATNSFIRAYKPVVAAPTPVAIRERKPRKKITKESIKANEVPETAESKEDAAEQIKESSKAIEEPTAEELKEIEPYAEQMQREVVEMSEKAAKKQKAQKIKRGIKGISEHQLFGELTNEAIQAEEGLGDESIDTFSKNVDALRKRTPSQIKEYGRIDDACRDMVQHGEDWAYFMDMYSKPPLGWSEKSVASEWEGKRAYTNAADILRFAINVTERRTPKARLLPIAKLILKNFESALKAVETEVVNVEGQVTHYNSDTDSISINLNSTVSVFGKTNVFTSVLHEVAHALSVYAISKNPQLRAELHRLRAESIKYLDDTTKELLRECEQYERDEGFMPGETPAGAYYLNINMPALLERYDMRTLSMAYTHTGIREFLADLFSSRTFMNHLAVIKATPTVPSLKQKIQNWLHKVLTGKELTPANYSLMDELMGYGMYTFRDPINLPNNRRLQKVMASNAAMKANINESFGTAIKDIREIASTNEDIKTWQKGIPMWTLGRFFKQAKQIMHAFQEGQRTLHRILFEYEYDVDAKGKQIFKSFLALSKPWKKQSMEQQLFDKALTQGDLLRKDLERAEIEELSRTNNLGLTREQIDKVEEAYKEIRTEYTRFWHWYWENVRTVSMRVYEHRAWYPELRNVMLKQGTQISDEVADSIRESLGEDEYKQFERARNSMLRAWEAIRRSEASMVAGYMPRQRDQGNYRVNVYKKDGSFAEVQFASNAESARELKSKLQKQYPGQKIEANYKTKSPENIFNDFDVNDIEAFLRSISKQMEAKEELSDEQISEFYTTLEERIANKFKPTGFKTHRIQRVGQAGEAIRGYKETNLHEVFIEYIRNGAGSIRKMNFAFDSNNILRGIDVTKQGDLYEYIRQYRDDMLRSQIATDRVISYTRATAFMWYLCVNLKATAVNLTQNGILGVPLYARATGLNPVIAYPKAMKDINKAMMDTFLYKMGKTDHLSAEDLLILERGKIEGDTGAMQLSYMSGAMERSFGSRFTAIVNLLGTPFALAETINREAALLAFHRLHKEQGHSDAYEMAREATYNVHFPYGKHNYPELVRAKGLLGQTGHLLSTFRSYTIMYVATIFESFRGADGKVSMKNCDVFFGSIAILMALGGLSAPWIDDILDLYERMSGNPIRSKIRKKLRETGGEKFSWAGMHGIPALLGIDITGSLRIGIPFLGEGGVEETIVGVYGGMEFQMVKGKEAFDIANYYRAFEEWSPTFVRNAMKSYREYNQGATTIDGKPITDPEGLQFKPTLPEAVLKAIGFRIERRAELSEELRTTKNIQGAFAKERQKIYARYRMAETSEDYKKILPRVVSYNEEAEKLEGAVPYIDSKSIRQAVKNRIDKRRLFFALLMHKEEGEDAFSSEGEDDADYLF